jgi:RNA polymerase sigma-70 factor (ECF subfamily)
MCEDLWLGLPAFAWRSSARTWAYILARNAASRQARAPHRRQARNLTFERHVPISQLVADVRARTVAHRRTETKDRFRALRDRLEPEDQMLLILRVDRELSWQDLSHVMLGDDPSVTPQALAREASRLRKRFERIKTELRRMAVEEGLLEDRQEPET